MKFLLTSLVAAFLVLGAPAQATAAGPEPGECKANPGAACEKPVDTNPTAPSTNVDEEEKKPDCTEELKKAGLCNPKSKKQGSGGRLGWITNPLGQLSQTAAAGSTQMIQWMSTWWINVDSPELEGDDKEVTFLRMSTHWLVGFTVTLGLLVAAARTAWERRGEPLRQALSGLLGLVVVSACSVTVVNLSLKAGDAFSEAILKASLAGDASLSGQALSHLLSAGVFSNPLVAIVLALLVTLSGLIQFGMMMLRSIMVVVLAGLLPLSSAAAITESGREWRAKTLRWLLAYITLKPAAAILYAIAFRWLKQGDGFEPVQGLVLIILAVITLPALLRFFAPMTSAGTGSGGGGAAVAAGAAALGARALPNGMGRSSAGPTGSAQPAQGRQSTSQNMLAPGSQGQSTSRPQPGERQREAPASPGSVQGSQQTAEGRQPAGQQPSRSTGAVGNAARGAQNVNPAMAAASAAASGIAAGREAAMGAVNNAMNGGPSGSA